MTVKKWQKAPPENVAAFDAALPSHPKVERRTMFGYPCAFVNGNMFTGLHEDNVCVRLGAEAASARIEKGEGRSFCPMEGRVMKEYVAIPREHCTDVPRLKTLMEAALGYTLALTPKTKKANAPPKQQQPKSKKKRVSK